MFGDAGCGKTTLTQRYLTNVFKSDSRMTIGVEFEVKALEVAGKKVKLQIWDFGGEERFRFLLPTYVKGANAGIFLYDVTNYSSLGHIDDWLLVVNKEVSYKIPILVVGGKADLDDREVTAEEGINVAKSRGTEGFVECSAKSGENVAIVFEAITQLMLQKAGLI